MIQRNQALLLKTDYYQGSSLHSIKVSGPAICYQYYLTKAWAPLMRSRLP